MSCPRANRRAACRAFTLLEVMIATVIIAFLIFTVHRFVRANLTAIRVATDFTAQDSELSGLVAFLQAQMEDLPLQTPGALLGVQRKFNNLQADELQWRCRGGLGVLTAHAPNDYRVTLAIQPTSRGSGELELGLRRQDINLEEKTYSWLPLLRPARALKLSYFDARLNGWADRWGDLAARPALIRLEVWTKEGEPPLEAILTVPSARMQGIVQ